MKAEDIDFTEILEGRSMTRAEDPDLSLLQEADNYHVSLDELEKTKKKEKDPSSSKAKKDETWRSLDINLSDVINQFVSSSERPAFLIRDDKLVYLNSAAMSFLEIDLDKGYIGNSFFNLVAQEDWKVLAENIGEMLTNNLQLKVRLKTTTGKLKTQVFSAIYLSEIEHFSFILLGEHPQKSNRPAFNNLYDDLTGLPNFFLFEDRVHVAISLENAKEDVRERQMIAVAAINIDNIDSFRKMHIEELVIKKAAGNLVLNLPKNATVALGLKYHFWVLLPALKTKADVNNEVQKIFDILKEGVHDNLTHHELVFSMGVSVFPVLGHSSKKIVEQALNAVKTAQNNPKSSVAFFVPQDI